MFESFKSLSNFVRIRKCNHGVSGILLVHYKESLLLNTVHKNVPRLAQ